MWDFFKCCECFKGKDFEVETTTVGDYTKRHVQFSHLEPIPIHTENFWVDGRKDEKPKKHKKPLIPRLVFINEREN